MAKTVKISNISEFRTVAAEYGVDVPSKQGRPPAVKLAQAIVAAGDKITPTEYFDGRTEYKTVVQARNVGKSEWVVTGTREHTSEKNGKSVTRKMPFKKTVAIGDVRAFLGQSTDTRGRISGEAFAQYLTDVFKGAVTIKDRVKVGAPVAAPAAQTPVEPVSEPAKGEDTDESK